jgi:aspartate aminotransferase
MTSTVMPAALPFSIGPAAIAVSPTLAANELMAARQRRGEPVMPLAFGEAGLPAHPSLRRALAGATGQTGYGPVAGQAALREAAAGYWERRGLGTDPDAIVCGPGSKALLFGLMLAIGGDVAVPRPSWVSYAAQASLIGARPWFVDIRPGEGGVPDPARLGVAVRAARAEGREIRSVILTLPDNPTGTLASAATIRDLCQVAEDHNLIIISDEIYRDLVHEPIGTDGANGAAALFTSPAAIAPGRTIVTTALSKSLALGGWRIGVARLPGGDAARSLRRRLRARLLGIGSEIWSAPAAPIQQAAAFAFSDPPELTERIALSRRLHRDVARAVADRFTAAGARVPAPQAAFYLYPDFGPVRDLLRTRHDVTTSDELADLLLRRHGMGVLPGSAFGEDPDELRLRVATGLLYGDTDEQREAALGAPSAREVPWIAASLARIGEVLDDVTG